jgi:hypothetical protein
MDLADAVATNWFRSWTAPTNVTKYFLVEVPHPGRVMRCGTDTLDAVSECCLLNEAALTDERNTEECLLSLALLRGLFPVLRQSVFDEKAHPGGLPTPAYAQSVFHYVTKLPAHSLQRTLKPTLVLSVNLRTQVIQFLSAHRPETNSQVVERCIGFARFCMACLSRPDGFVSYGSSKVNANSGTHPA